MKKALLILILAIFPLIAMKSYGQVSINPGIIFIDPLTKTGSAELHNTSNHPAEVDLDFTFAYESFVDTANKIILIREDSVLQEKYDLKPYIRVFPKKIIIQPKKKQVVRFLIRNANSLEDGTYWSRIAIKSTKHQKDIDTTYDPDKITANIVTWYNMTFPIYFQKGNVTTDIEIENIRNKTFNGDLALEMDLNKTGNSPFWGIISLTIYDEEDDDEPVEKIRQLLPIHVNHMRRFMLDTDKYKSGKKYRVELEVTNDELPDIIHIPLERLIRMSAYSKEFEFIAP